MTVEDTMLKGQMEVLEWCVKTEYFIDISDMIVTMWPKS